MSARRAHAKSRTGCADCKRRRVKCDERRPACSNCHKRGIRCSFHDFDPVYASAPSITPRSTHSGALSQIHVFPTQEPEDPKSLVDDILSAHTQQRLLEQLPEASRPQYQHVLEHFATTTVLTLSPGTAGQDAWCKAFPLFAKDHGFVLHGALAISCLHLSRLADTQGKVEQYQEWAATQMNLGMVGYSKELDHIGVNNAEVLLTFSTTLTTFTNYTAALECREALNKIRHAGVSHNDSSDLTSKSVDAICRTFRSIRGVLVILVPCWHQLKAGMLEPVVDRDWWPPHVPTTPKELEADNKLRQLETMWSCPGRSYEYFFDNLRAALKSLREAFALVSRLDNHALPGDTSVPRIFDWTSLFDWPVSLSLEFLAQLEQRRWEAWVIVAHHAILVHKMNHHLWLEGMGVNILSTAALVIGRDRWKWLDWPSSVIGVDLQTLQSVEAAIQ